MEVERGFDVGILNFIKEYWVMITFFIGEIVALLLFAKYVVEAVKCLLRNDILNIYDRCKDTKRITRYQLQSVHLSYEIYKKLKGNSFIDEIMKEIKDFEIVG
jgi:hypothetical protein